MKLGTYHEMRAMQPAIPMLEEFAVIDRDEIARLAGIIERENSENRDTELEWVDAALRADELGNIVIHAQDEDGDWWAIEDPLQNAVVQRLQLNPEDAHGIVDAAVRIIEAHQQGRGVQPSDFPDAEWRALLGVANAFCEVNS